MALTTRTNRHRPRPGFTLIEILVVLSIIAVLAALGGAAYQRVRITQMQRTTEDLVGKLQGGVDDQHKVITDNTRLEKLKRSSDFGALVSYCGGDADRAEALLCYCRVKQNFPQSTADLQQTMTAPPLAGQPGFTVGGVNFPRPPAFAKLAALTGTPDQISAACLYVALAERTLGGKTFASDEATSGRQGDINVGGTTVRVYLDPWGQPVPYVRFLDSAELQQPPYAKGTAGGAKDPYDPLGKLAAWGANGSQAATILGTAFDNRNKAVAVYSLGRNGTFDNLDRDDVVGYRQRSLGKKGAIQP